MRILIFLVIALSFVVNAADADPEQKNPGSIYDLDNQPSSECSCSIRKQHQTKLRIEKNKQKHIESKKKSVSEPSTQ